MNFTRFVWLVVGGSLIGMLSTPPAEGPIGPKPVAVSLLEEETENSSTEQALRPVNERFASETDEIPDFQRHVGPLLGRLGCNGRACHGSFQGQGGLQLSLFGYDFDKDHKALTEDGSYRVDLEDPDDSLMLVKPTDAEDHGGGLRFEADSWQYQLISNWITAGARNFDNENRLVTLKVIPEELVTSKNQVDQIRVVAKWSNGIEEDVSPLVRFQSNDPQIASIDENGKVTGGSPGDTHLIVFYDNEVVSIPVIAPVRAATNHSAAFRNPTRIDELVLDKLNKLGIEPSSIANDTEFLRRVSLDVTGTLPSPDEIRAFLDNNNSDKRSNKIEELLDSNAYSAWWTTFLCDLTGNSSRQLRNVAYNESATSGWYEWIHKRVKANVPYDEIVQGIVLSTSRQPSETLTDYCSRMTADYRERSTERFADAPTMPYYWMRREFNTGDTLAISFAHSFLGVRLQCAQCHKHPFDQWTQDDFQQFSRFFSGVAVSPAQRANPNEKAELQAIYASLNIDPTKVRGGELRRKLSQAIKDGQTVPFPELTVGPPRKSRAELKAEQEELKSKMAAKQNEMQDEMQDATQNEMGDEMQADENTDKKPLTREQRKRRQREARRQAQRNRNRNRFYTDAILLGSDSVELKDFKDARVPAMNWLKHEDNPYFAKAIVNRIWAKYFGVGIVEPPDDMNLANPPSNGPLLDYLADGFVTSGYDLKWVHREITNSNIYQLSWEANETNRDDRRNFSRALPRRLAAEVVYDAIEQATANPQANKQFRDNVKNRAIAIPGTTSRQNRRQRADINFAMRVFGKSERNSSCDCDRSNEASLVQTVFLRNDNHIHQRLVRADGWLGQMLGQVQGQPLDNNQLRRLAHEEGQLKNLELGLRKARNRNDQPRIEKLERQVRKLNARLEPLRERRLNMAKREKPEFDADELISEAWLRTLGRFPTVEEIELCRKYIEADKEILNAMTGIMWSLVNTKEFIVNH